jgi:peptide/nickel transport system substrate-binding protein
LQICRCADREKARSATKAIAASAHGEWSDTSEGTSMITRRSLLRSSALGLAYGVLSERSSFGATPAIVTPGGELRVAIFADPLVFDPHTTGNLQGRAACRAIHDPLFKLDESGRLAPCLVESWETPDDKSFVLKVRERVKFHDGTPLDAEAVRYNIERVRSPQLGTLGLRASEITALDTVQAIDPLHIKLTLKYPFAAFLFPFTDVAGCIGSPTAFEKWGRDYGFHPVGTGPFRLVEYLKDDHTVLEKNGDYWRAGLPYLDRIILRPIPTDSTRLAELKARGVHIAEALPLQNIRDLRNSKEVMVSERVGFRWEYFGFNCRQQYPGHSQKLRQAFQWAIDREELHQVAYFGTGSIGYDAILPSSPFHDPNYKPFTHDLEKAKRLIDESGISLPTTIRAPLQQDPVKQRAGQVFQATAAKLGVNVQIEAVDSAGYLATWSGGTLPIDLFGWFGFRPDPDQCAAQFLDPEGHDAQWYGYNNPKLHELVVAERTAGSEAGRRKAFREMMDIMNEDAAYVSWHYSSDFKGLLPEVRGFVHAPDAIISFDGLYLAT